MSTTIRSLLDEVLTPRIDFEDKLKFLRGKRQALMSGPIVSEKAYLKALRGYDRQIEKCLEQIAKQGGGYQLRKFLRGKLDRLRDELSNTLCKPQTDGTARYVKTLTAQIADTRNKLEKLT